MDTTLLREGFPKSYIMRSLKLSKKGALFISQHLFSCLNIPLFGLKKAVSASFFSKNT